MENPRSDSVWRRGSWSAEAGGYSGKENEFVTREIAELPREFGIVETETSAGSGNSGEWSTTEECEKQELENSDENGSGNSSETEEGKLAPVVLEAIAAATENNSPTNFGKLGTDWMDHVGSLR